MCKECQAEILCVEAEDADGSVCRSAPPSLCATSPGRGRHARQGRKHDVCAVASKGGKDAANKGQQATTKTHEFYTDRICAFCSSGEYRA